MSAANARPDEVAEPSGPDGKPVAPPGGSRTASGTDRWSELDDNALLTLSRRGEPEAFAELFRRHRPTALRVAARTTSDLDPEDVASEAFARVWLALSRGRGPEHAFRPYLLAAVRNVALNGCRGDRELPTDPAVLPDPVVEPDELSTAIAEAQLVCTAFASLPDRWQHALWATEVEQQPMAEFARSIGTSPNAASALCLRARDGLKSAWLQAHVRRTAPRPECEWTLARLGAHARHRLPAGQSKRVEEHLAECESCSTTLSRLAFIGRSLKTATLFAGAGGTALAVKAVSASAAGSGSGALLMIRPADSLVGPVHGLLRDGWCHLTALARRLGALVARSGARLALAGASAAVAVLAVVMVPSATGALSDVPLALTPAEASAPTAPQPTASPSAAVSPAKNPSRIGHSHGRSAAGALSRSEGRHTTAPITSSAPNVTPAPSALAEAPTPTPSAGDTVAEPAAPTTGSTPGEIAPSTPPSPQQPETPAPQPDPRTSPSMPGQPAPEPTPPAPTVLMPPSPAPPAPSPTPVDPPRCLRPPVATPGPRWPIAVQHWPGWCPLPRPHR